MIKILLKKFVPDFENVKDKKVRENYTTLSGILGIVCNLVLFAVKFIIGSAMTSIAITSDAFNNLSDMGTSVMAIIGAKLSSRRPDADHPFGHGRFEYISSLIISFIIMLVGFELLQGSFDKVLNPEPISAKPILLIILALSVLVKFWMWSYNNFMGKKIDSNVLKAVASDSLNDVITTAAVILSSVIGFYLKINIDGYIGCIVSVLIMYVGFTSAKDTVDILLGRAPDKEMVKEVEDLLTQSPDVLGIHDLVVHDYGPGRVFASVHAEVSDKGDITAIHEEMDALEQKCMSELGIELVVHMDPIATDSSLLSETRAMVVSIVNGLGNYSIHDFRMTDGENRVNLIFDIVVPASMRERERNELVSSISAALKNVDSKYCAVIKIDNDYSSQL